MASSTPESCAAVPEPRAAGVAERLARHDRWAVIAGLVVLSLLAWAYLASGAGMANDMAMSAPLRPTLGQTLLIIAMWWVMMIAMMLPSAAPAILLYAQVRRHRKSDSAIGASWLFGAGYLAAWGAYATIAAGAQMLLVEARVIDAMRLGLTVPALAGGVAIAAGIYQLSWLKYACLSQCRSPASFLARHWRPGAAGAVRLGLLHGAYCVGCCGLLMALLFVGGVMNMTWVGALAALIAIEKIVRGGALIGRGVGVALIVGGALAIAG